ncbi:MAG: glycosyltransferase family 4 protein [Bacteroidales bacterium]
MRVLQLCHKLPYPPSDGGSIAMHQITKGLMDKGIDVKVMALVPSGNETALEKIPIKYIRQTQLETFPIDTRVKPLPAFINIFTRESYNISRFYCKKAAKRLGEILDQETFDIIQMEGLFLTPYISVIRQHTGTPILFRSHNIEHFIWERMARSAKNPLKRQYLKFLASRLKSYEMETVHQVDGLVAISPVDLRFFRENGFAQPSVTVPVAVEAEKYAYADVVPEENTVFHLGSMDWRPNQEGVRWFLQEVWPLVVSRQPELHFILAGKKIPEWFNHYEGENVLVAGEVPDAVAFMHSRQLMVVPLRSGGGMRVKIVEGMAAGKAIVSTSIGAEGIDCNHDENILLADTPEEMADTILYCFSDPDKMKQLGRQARQFAAENHATGPIMDRLITFYNTFYSA